jgi:hypothetical protein
MSPADPKLPSRRQIILTAADILMMMSHAEFDRLLMEFGIQDLRAGRDLGGMAARTNALARFVLDNPERETEEGLPLPEALILRAERVVERLGHLEPGTKEAEFLEAVTRPDFAGEKVSPERLETPQGRSRKPSFLRL